MDSNFVSPAIMAPDSPRPLHPSPGPHRPFPSPTPHISLREASYVPIPYIS
ncbi:MAG: hypothetical protein NWF05_01385 [Candidatus Bathyarchaeota archaeon]|nr:hypothetical protein [Candidatus Bathyarchaeota archaeon]